MRTKSLLIAAAALAATVISSEAQTVYSANIVGYANVVIPGNGAYSLIANPFDDGNGNQLTNILSSAIANKTQVVTWNGTSFNTPITKGGGVWPSSVPLVPGQGFFIKLAGSGVTNTFVGSLAVPSGAGATNSVINGYSLVGSIIPFAGDVTTDTNINLGATLANKSQLVGWDPVGQAYLTPDTKGGGVWPSAFNVSVGQGFFVKTGTATNWVQTAP